MASDIYCDTILRGLLAVKVLAETEQVLAFEHTQPYWQTHIVVIPKKHIESLSMLTADDSEIIRELMSVASRLCRDVEARHGGCRLSTNIGNYQSSKHLHLYIHAGPRLRDEDGAPIPH